MPEKQTAPDDHKDRSLAEGAVPNEAELARQKAREDHDRSVAESQGVFDHDNTDDRVTFGVGTVQEPAHPWGDPRSIPASPPEHRLSDDQRTEREAHTREATRSPQRNEAKRS